LHKLNSRPCQRAVQSRLAWRQVQQQLHKPL
jgi:hypothetical protein